MNKVSDPAYQARLRRRHAAERRFRAVGLGAILLSVMVLAFLLVTMGANALEGLRRSEVRFTLDLMAAPTPSNQLLNLGEGALDGPDAMQRLQGAGLPEAVAAAAERALGSDGAAELDPDAWREVGERLIDDPSLVGSPIELSLPVSERLAGAQRGEARPELNSLAQRLEREGKLVRAFDPGFFSRSDATNPQDVGIWGALKGSLLTMLVTLALAFPIGVLAAVYLEEFAARNRLTEFIEVSINNLAAVPSIIYGLLGLAVFLTIFPYYRSAPLIGGMTLALMTMPVIVISGRNAIKAVPPSIRDAALAVGASKVQTVFHHVLPLALPGVLTGTIIGMARALGETAPLLMIGMRAFVATPPEGVTSPATVLPVQIFLWSDEINRGFVERTSAAIIVLLAFLLAMNGLAIYLRNKFETRW